ncbi:hypothetical protein [Kibdelosporangium phytohabitans]|uniref:Uncharacterized protein n=1 Tax=Kibdelosporangium phytohabitans TaxID=860235 RepID=A0A0N7F2N3_9PSEU|nr:hypothetical protein [Kibdelosporangium phytohabitans]ALG06311.1 hypothetical protein AOZ06_04670 [Kibdelosporangium phytohabitans]MBE1467431.1 hypothetical protein [Kibdelosporangium phytohabitans]
MTDRSTQLPSELLRAAVRKLQGDGHVTIQGPIPTDVRDLNLAPFVELLLDHVAIYKLYERPGRTEQQIAERVAPADRAALQCARTILASQPQNLVTKH